MNVTVFEAINITKKYRNTLALNQVSMSVMQGDIYGFSIGHYPFNFFN